MNQMSDAYQRFINSEKKRGKKMGTLLSVWTWLKKYWYIPVFVIVSIIVWLFFRRSGMPLEQVLTEIKAIQAKADVDKMKAEIGTEQAKVKVTEQYHEELKALDEKQAKQAKEFENDPAKLAKFLVRAGSKHTDN